MARPAAALIRICVRANPRLVVALVACDAASTVLRLAAAYGVKLGADAVVAGDRGGVILAAVWMATALAAASLTAQSFIRMTDRLIDIAALEIDTRLMRLASEITTIDHIERPEYRDRMTLLRQDREHMPQMVNAVVLNLRVAVAVLGTTLMLIQLDPLLALMPLTGIPLAVAHRAARRRTQRARRANASRSRLRDHYFQVGTSAEAGAELRLFGLGDELRRRHGEVFEHMQGRTFRAALAGWALTSLAGVLFTAVYAALLGVCVYRAVTGGSSVGWTMLAIVLFGLISAQMSAAALASAYLQQVVSAGEHLVWLEEYARARPSGPGVAGQDVPTALRTGIRLHDVSFHYPGTESLAVNSVDLLLPAGSCVALVGENGSGKSTLVKLLSRMYEPTSGLITVDGVPLTHFDPAEWRAAMSAGFQDHARLEVLVREAVGVGDLPAAGDEARVATALDQAGAGSFVARLPEGVNTQLGSDWPNGVELSGGQWQKIALARAQMRTSPLLTVMDEPAASLDAASEYELFQRLAAIRAETTGRGGILLFVSHRLTTARSADLVIVMEAGRVRELGTHEELRSRDGLYSELFTLQERVYR
jgi:ATP-binding cassette subfamily B protein